MKQMTFMNERRHVPKRWKLLFLLAASFLSTTITAPGPPPPRLPRLDATLRATPVLLDPRDPARRRAGALVFRRGWALQSDAPRFGAISAMTVDGGEVAAVSDAGDLFLFALPEGVDTGRVRVLALPIVRGSPAVKRNRDTESLAAADGRIWVGFERGNLIARYRRGDAALEGFARPEAMRRWPRNAGAEAMVRLADGRFLVFGEGTGGAAETPLILFDGDPSVAGTPALVGRYRRPDGYRATDAAVLPDGRLLILNRRVDWIGEFSVKLVIADLPDWRAGAIVAGREIATLEAPLTVDNMEALSVAAAEDGRTIVRIASDDNFMRMQRTLLLEFELDERAARDESPRR